MKLIERKDIDIARWDELVRSKGKTIFSLSLYLDTVAENWCVLVDEDYSSGIALPYTVRVGKKTLYTPLFLRCLEYHGTPHVDTVFILKNEFPKADFSVSSMIEQEGREFIYQVIEPADELKFNDQTKRSLKKFEKSSFTIVESVEVDSILKIISAELSPKIESVNNTSIPRLKALVNQLSEKGYLKTYHVLKDGETHGGAFFIEFNSRVIYLKSAFREGAKKEGAMYAIMTRVIEDSKKNSKIFDFGGSRVEGVRRFNKNLGGKDEVYYNYQWDSMPSWFKGLKKLKDTLYSK